MLVTIFPTVFYISRRGWKFSDFKLTLLFIFEYFLLSRFYY